MWFSHLKKILSYIPFTFIHSEDPPMDDDGHRFEPEPTVQKPDALLFVMNKDEGK